jgi:transposase
MGFPAGVRRDFEALEQRRMRAARLLEKGYSQSEVARRVGAHRQSVSQWATELQEKGRVEASWPGGPQAKARCHRHRQNRAGIAAGAGGLGLHHQPMDLCAAHLIETACGVRYHPGHVWRILRQLGWSCQRPPGRALERNEEKIRQWKQKRWPEIKKKPKTSGARSFSSTKAH